MSRPALLPLLGALVLGLAWPLAGTAQDRAAAPDQHKHAGKSADADKDLATQVRELQAQVAKLEAALKQGHQGTAPGSGGMSAKGMGGMAGKSVGMMGGQKMGQGAMGMGGMEGMNPDEMMKMMQMMGTMKGMQGGMPGMMGMEMMGGKGMEMMGGMKGMGGMPVPSALPGFPGASHIYHIGATGFFLDHPEHVQLTTKQQSDLNQIKEKALLDQASAQRKIDEAEQELWALTASDQPNAAKIEAEVHEIEKLRGDQRLAFIRAVGEAAKVLTDEQHKALLGVTADKADKPAAHAGH
jgi:Spy/CpxP family protein refolding chaperone